MSHRLASTVLALLLALLLVEAAVAQERRSEPLDFGGRPPSQIEPGLLLVVPFPDPQERLERLRELNRTSERLSRALREIRFEEADGGVRVRLPTSTPDEPERDWVLWRPRVDGVYEPIRQAIEEIDLPQDSMLVLRSGRGPSVPLTESETTLPSRGLFARVEPGGQLKKHSVRLDIRATRVPVRWDPQVSAYAAELVLLCREESDDLDPITLPRAIELQFLVEGSGTVEPDRVRIGGTGLGGNRVLFHSDDHRQDARIIAVSPAWGEHACTLEIAPELDRLAIDFRKTAALGLGVEEVEVTVERFAEDGRPWADDTPLTVRLEGNAGIFPAQVTIPAHNSQAVSSLRTSGFEDIRLKAVMGSVRSDAAALALRFPWLLLVLTSVFGALGGFFRGRHEGAEAEAPAERRRRIRNRSVFGSLTGFVLVALVALGLNVSEIDAPLVLSELGCSVVAIVGGWTGATVFSLVSTRLAERRDAPEGDPG